MILPKQNVSPKHFSWAWKWVDFYSTDLTNNYQDCEIYIVKRKKSAPTRQSFFPTSAETII